MCHSSEDPESSDGLASCLPLITMELIASLHFVVHFVLKYVLQRQMDHLYMPLLAHAC